ncbi:MAG: glycosyltransferase [Magnetococcales bacterium]|nr:glycosyltransferase [Magnetococcales bacterium]
MLSVVVNFHNNRREARNTLYSLSRAGQRETDGIDYEVIVLDHGSSLPLSESDVRGFGPEFSLHFVQTTDVSPVRAINAACREARGEHLLVIIDGAHILSPGVIRRSMEAFSLFPSPFVATVPFHLGPARQNLSRTQGYDQAREDWLLGQSGWREDGYRLFHIAGAFADDSGGWFGELLESGCFGLRREAFLELGGLDERFRSPGGGLVNLDFFRRALERGDWRYVVLLGEATFHQFHGGVASNALIASHPWQAFHDEYMRIRGCAFRHFPRQPYLLGSLPGPSLGPARLSIEQALRRYLS